jgi:hypothetical protein
MDSASHQQNCSHHCCSTAGLACSKTGTSGWRRWSWAIAWAASGPLNPAQRRPYYWCDQHQQQLLRRWTPVGSASGEQTASAETEAGPRAGGSRTPRRAARKRRRRRRRLKSCRASCARVSELPRAGRWLLRRPVRREEADESLGSGIENHCKEDEPFMRSTQQLNVLHLFSIVARNKKSSEIVSEINVFPTTISTGHEDAYFLNRRMN